VDIAKESINIQHLHSAEELMLYRFAALLKLEWSEVATSSDKA